MGAAVGIDGLPRDMLDKVLQFDCASDELVEKTIDKKGGKSEFSLSRPGFLSVKFHFESCITKLVEKRPQVKVAPFLRPSSLVEKSESSGSPLVKKLDKQEEESATSSIFGV